MKTCSLCAMENEDSAKFCVKCGGTLSSTASTTSQAQASSSEASAQPSANATTSGEQTAATPQATSEQIQPASTQSTTEAQANYNANAQGYQSPSYGNAQPGQTGAWASQDAAVQYEVSETDKTLRLIAFALGVATCVGWGIGGLVTFGILLIPLAWSIPLTVCCWGIYKGTRPNTAVFGVCTLIFLDFISGILLLISKTDEQ